ncbi:MAG: GNAT family N-acetyltransferase [Vicinamibacterales bacterium]|nr:GNAT family N-acetyltransferase [Vicinamibacterales bacterium]
MTQTPDSYPPADLPLARRLERTEGAVNAAFVEARARLDPDSRAAWTSIAGVYAMYDGVDSPLTQTFGLGVFEPVGAAEFDALEAYFVERGAPVHHEVSPYLPADTLIALGERGYRPFEVSTVLVRPTDAGPGGADGIAVREIDAAERSTWAKVAGEGWSSESEALASFIEAFGQIVTRAADVHCFVAEREGTPIAAGTLALHGDTALLAGASTVPAARRQGAQRALLDARLRFARDRGATLAMVVTAPGSGSQRNAERQGFRVAYTRTKWRRAG